MLEILEAVIIILEKYFVFIYPGFISYFLFCFGRTKKIEKNYIVLITSIVISYVYIIIYKFVRNAKVEEFINQDYIALLLMSIVLPILWNWISRTKWFESFLKFFRIYTTIEENALDYVRYRAKGKNEGIVVKVFLDDMNIMYEGGLRFHESDVEKESDLCLSGYRRYKKIEGEWKVIQNYENDSSRWVLIKGKDVKRIEVNYSEKK